MNWKKFRENVGMWVELQPPAYELDAFQRPLKDLDREWFIQSVEEDGFTLSYPATGHVAILGKDHLYSYVSNPGKSKATEKHGFLKLHVQIFVQGANLSLKPTLRPGERLALSNQPHHQVQWTPYRRVSISNFVPPTAAFIQIQYRLWSNITGIPLQIRVSSREGQGIMVEHSGASGVIKLMLEDRESIFISTSHPEVHFELSVLGWEYA